MKGMELGLSARLNVGRQTPRWRLSAVILVIVASFVAVACSSDSTETSTPTSDSDTTMGADAAANADVVAPDVGTPDVGTPDAGPDDTGTPDTGPADTGPEDMGQPDMGQPDMGEPDIGEPEVVPAELLVDNQTLQAPYDSLNITAARLPGDALNAGTIRVTVVGGDQDGTVLGEKTIAAGAIFENEAFVLDDSVVGTQAFVAELIDSTGTAVAGIDGEPLSVGFTLIGDTESPSIVMKSQDISSDDFKTLILNNAVVPQRFKVGVWITVYEDDEGTPGALRGKLKLLPGTHEDVELQLTTQLKLGRLMHARMIEAQPGSGSFNSGNPVIKNLANQNVEVTYFADNIAFHPLLEVEDQTLVVADELLVKTVTMPPQYIGGGWVAIYADDDGAQGALIGKLQYTPGTKVDKIVGLTVDQEGQKTLHAVLHVGQKWVDAENVVMLDANGAEVRITFQVGAGSLSYINAPPYTTSNPRHVVVQRAYSFHKPAWVVLARDDNGQPGTILAQKRILKKFAGNVHLHSLYGDFLESGSMADFLKAMPGTFRRTVRGNETLHVMLYEDDPQDSQFTWTEGGTEDVPVLNSDNQPIHEMIEVTVESSIQNQYSDSERYYSPCPLSQNIGNPAALPVDCRCHVDVVGLDFPECKREIADFLGLQYGDGPRASTHNFGRFRSGFPEPETNSLIGLIEWKDHQTKWPENNITIDVGAVVRIDAETRDRTIISGRYMDPVEGIKTVGTGPVLSYPFEVQKGANGKYYVASYAYNRLGASLTPTVDIISVDPTTGDRAYVWRSNHLGFNLDNEPNPYGHCGNGRTETWGYYSVQIGRKAFGIDEAGNFYLSYAHNGNTPTSDGIGILKIGADGSTCDFVTRTKVGADNVLYQGVKIGGGIEPQAGPYKGMLVKDGKIYTSTALDDDLYQIDIATGDRTALHVETQDNVTGSSGTHVVWDKYRSLIWQAGLASSVLLYDTTNGDVEPLWCPENFRDFKGISCVKMAAWGNNGLPLERGLWMHPTDGDYMFIVNGPMIQRVHLASGSSEIFSF